MSLKLSRQNFYNGQNVSPNNMNQLQDYTDNNIQNIVSQLIGTGVIYGFEVEKISEWVMSINVGLGFNRIGERLVLDKKIEYHIKDIEQEETVIAIGLKKSIIEENYVINNINQRVPSIITPTVSIEVINESSELDKILHIADITVNSEGITSIEERYSKLLSLSEHALRTKSLQTKEDGTEILNKNLVFKGSKKLLLESPSINLITNNLLLNNIAIVEVYNSSDNSLGHIKFGNGFLICYGSYYVPPETLSGHYFYSHEFITNPSIHISQYNSYMGIYIDKIYTDNFNIYIEEPGVISFFAYGYWKNITGE